MRGCSHSCILTGGKHCCWLEDTLNAPRSHWLRVEKDSSQAISEEMGFLDSINEEKIVEGER